MGEAAMTVTAVNIFFRSKSIPLAATAHDVWYCYASSSPVSSTRNQLFLLTTAGELEPSCTEIQAAFFFFFLKKI